MHAAHQELLDNWCDARDLETFEHVAKEAVDFVAGPVSIRFRVLSRARHLFLYQNCDIELQDQVCIVWLSRA